MQGCRKIAWRTSDDTPNRPQRSVTLAVRTAANRLLRGVALVVGVCGAAPLLAHHSPAAFDQTKEIRLEGTVTRFAYNNPHTYLTIDVVGPDGRVVSQEIEAGPISTMQPLGMTRDSLKIGDRVTVRAVPRRRGIGTVLGLDVTKANGTVVPLFLGTASARPASAALATSMAGMWRPLQAGFSALNRAVPSLPLTERGREELAAARRANATTHSDCVPAGAPMLMLYPVATFVTVNARTVVFDIDWLDAQRIVHLEATHPVNLEPSLQGHSIGRWEGDVLVVDTIGFAPHAEGIGFGLPSSASKHLVERFALEPDRRHLRYEVTVEDPVYLTEPVRRSAQWVFDPDLLPSGVRCDLDVARRYLREAQNE
jgi:hypothetical protein